MIVIPEESTVSLPRGFSWDWQLAVDVLSESAAQGGVEKVCIAHHADDQRYEYITIGDPAEDPHLDHHSGDYVDCF
jgi:hypothetical protein